MIRILKPMVTFLMFVVVLFAMTTILSITTQYPTWICATFSAVCAIWVGWFTWRLVSGEKIGVGSAVISGALMLGSLSFIIGFLGPIAITKDTSQGPFILLFIASPVGVIMGAIGGYLYAARQNAAGD